MTEKPLHFAVAKQLTPEEFAARDRDHATDLYGDGEGTRLRILGLLSKGVDRREGLPPDFIVIEDDAEVARIEAGLQERLRIVLARDRQAA